MVRRYDLRDEHGRITGYVLRETDDGPASFSRPARAHEPDSPLAVALCLALGTIMLVASLAYIWIATTAG